MTTTLHIPPHNRLFCLEGHDEPQAGCASCQVAREAMPPDSAADITAHFQQRTCKCGAVFTSFVNALCDDCVAREQEKLIQRGEAQMSLSRTFPVRAQSDIRSMRGPALDKARELLPRLQSGTGTILIVIGDRGTGKTVMATWWAARLGYGLYVKAFDLFLELRRTYHEGAKVREHEVMAKYRKAAFLVIDEAQDRKESEWEQTTLTNLVDKRYDAMLPTVIIANLKPDAIDACLGASIVSRAKRTGGGMVEAGWPAYH